MAEIAKLQKLLEAEGRASEERHRREEEQRQREEAEGRASEEQRRREKAEEQAKASQPQTLPQYLDACHSLSLAIDVVTDPSSTTQGDTSLKLSRLNQRTLLLHAGASPNKTGLEAIPEPYTRCRIKIGIRPCLSANYQC